MDARQTRSMIYLPAFMNTVLSKYLMHQPRPTSGYAASPVIIWVNDAYSYVAQEKVSLVKPVPRMPRVLVRDRLSRHPFFSRIGLNARLEHCAKGRTCIDGPLRWIAAPRDVVRA